MATSLTLDSSADLHTELPSAFIDPKTVRWPEVRRVQQALYQRFHYRYPGPIEDLLHRLLITPRAAYGGQTLEVFRLSVTPEVEVTHRQDGFGNAVLEARAPYLPQELRFESLSILACDAKPSPVPLSAADAERFLGATPLTTADAHMTAVSRELRGTYAGALAFAATVSAWVGRHMRYGFGATGTRTPAAEALAGGVGLCQDYAHIMIALCRAAGVRARYVSGHMLGEGGSHAWVEVLLPDGNAYAAYGFDPTNRRRPGPDYLTVAVGRDYSDVAPTSGTFSAPYGGDLTCTKRAGLTTVEYRSGEVVRV